MMTVLKYLFIFVMLDIATQGAVKIRRHLKRKPLCEYCTLYGDAECGCDR